MQRAKRWVLGVAAFVALFGGAGCERREVEPGGTYFERKVGPVLLASCATSPTGSGCHVTADDQGNALGNLDVTSFAMLDRRRDDLTVYGPYGMATLLAKAVPAFQVRLEAWDGEVEMLTTDIPHAGGAVIDPGSASFAIVQRWLERGALENNELAAPAKFSLDPCSDRVGSDPDFDPSVEPTGADFALFKSSVNDILVSDCSAGNCHGAPKNSLYLTCGKTPEQIRWNYFAAGDYVAADAPTSELLRRVLDPAQGGVFHEGGWFFASPNDPKYKDALAWAEAKGGPSRIPNDVGFELFAKRVQPMLVKKGCMLLGCHSPAAFNDLALRAGSAGHFALPATRNNYRLALEQVAMESPDPNVSRILAKNLEPGPRGPGIRHRGGALFAGSGDPSACDLTAAETGPLDEQDPYCVLVAWITRERAARMQAAAPLSAIVYVKRSPAPLPDTPQDFASYAPGSELRLAGASMDASGTVTLDGTDRSLMTGCGLDPTTADVRRPAVSWDGAHLAFAARTSASEPYRIYTARGDGSSCAVEPSIDAAPIDDHGAKIPTNGELIHNFDPQYAPDGSLVFVSTRGNIMNTDAFEYSGPQRSAADPSKLNANLYILEGDHVRQLTFLLDQELTPSFEVTGQVMFTTEKRAPGFYQLAGRRLNLDGGDYHPLWGQRGTIGANQLTSLVQTLDRNFAAILSDRGSVHSAGQLAVLNRSLGPDTRSDEADDYTADPSAMTFPAPAFFQHSMSYPDPASKARLGEPTKGAYRDISILPNGKILVSYAANVVDLGSFSGNFDVVIVDPVSGRRTPLPLLSDANADELWPVAVFGRYSRGVFHSSPKDPAGSAVIYTTDDGEKRTDRAQLTYMDFPLIASLMFQNTRGFRRVEKMVGFEIWENLPPTSERSLDDSSPFIQTDRFGKYYARQRLLGHTPLLKDGSTRVQIPGGVPISVGVSALLAGDSSPTSHVQREAVQYYPGEWVTLSFRRQMFDGFCGGCHGSLSGKEYDVSVKPDILTSASAVEAKRSEPHVLIGTASGSDVAPPAP